MLELPIACQLYDRTTTTDNSKLRIIKGDLCNILSNSDSDQLCSPRQAGCQHPAGQPGQVNMVVNMVVREGREEKVENKIIALEYIRQVLRELVVTEKVLRRVETAVEDEIKEIFLYYLY